MANTGLLHLIKRDRKKSGVTELPKGLTVVGLLLLLFFSSFLIYSLSNNLRNSRSSQPANEVELATDTKSQTSDWQTLDKPEWSFSIQYPPTYSVIKNDAQVIEIGADGNVDVTITNKVEKYDESNLCTEENTKTPCITGNGEPGKVETIVVGGQPGKSFISLAG